MPQEKSIMDEVKLDLAKKLVRVDNEVRDTLEGLKLQKALKGKPITTTARAVLTGKVTKDQKGTHRLPALTDMLGRLALTGMGTSMLASYLPAAKLHALGESTLWHGTPGAVLPSVLKGGLSTEFAGQNRRLNSETMYSSAVNMLEDALKAPLDPVEAAYLRESLQEGGAVANTLISRMEEIGKAHNLPKASLEHMSSALEAAGKRIYFGAKPHHVIEWGVPGNELHKIIASSKEMMENLERGASTPGASLLKPLKTQAEIVLPLTGDLLLGGLPTMVQQEGIHAIKERIARGKAVTHEVASLQDAAKLVKTLQEKGRITEATPVVLGVTVNEAAKDKAGRVAKKTLDVFSDFPVVGDIVASSAQLRALMKRFLPNYLPGRDISTAASIPAENIHTIMTYAKDGKGLTAQDIIKIKNAATPRVRPSLSGLKKLPFPLIMSALGADLVAKGITGKTLSGRVIDKARGQEKKAAVGKGTLGAIKKGLIGAGVVGVPMLAATIPSAIVADKSKQRLADAGYPGTHLAIPAVGAAVGQYIPNVVLLADAGKALAAATRTEPPNYLPLINNADRFTGEYLSSIPMVATTSLPQTAVKAETGALPGVPESFAEKYPVLTGSLATALPLSALAGAGTYVASKYYMPSLKEIPVVREAGEGLKQKLQQLQQLYGEKLKLPTDLTPRGAAKRVWLNMLIPLLLAGGLSAGIGAAIPPIVEKHKGLVEKAREIVKKEDEET